MLYLPNVMLRNTKHILHACLLFALIIFMTPSANAQIPSLVGNGWQIIGYQVNTIPAPPALYNSGVLNSLHVDLSNISGPSQVNVGVWVDTDQNGVYAPFELVYSNLTPITITPGNTGFTQGLTSIPLPPGLPGNTNTFIGVFELGASLDPYHPDAFSIIAGKVGKNTDILAIVQDDINFNIPDCPIDTQTFTEDILGTNLLCVQSPRDLDIEVSIVNSSIPPSTIYQAKLIKSVFYINNIGGIPQPLPSSYLLPSSHLFTDHTLIPKPYPEDLKFIYFPNGVYGYEVYYHLEDEDGYLIPLSTANTNIVSLNGTIPAYKSWSFNMCSRDHYNENLTQEIIDMLEAGEYEYEAPSIEGRKSNISIQDEPQAVLFPNPSSGTTFLQFELKESAQISWQILNSQGQIVGERRVKNIKSGRYSTDLDTGDLPSGLYVVKYQFGEETHQARFIKQ